MYKDTKKTDWHGRLIKGIGILVCAASAALMCYLLWVIKKSGPEPILLVFCLIPMITFCAGGLCIYLFGYGKQKQEEMQLEKGEVMGKIGILSDTHGLLRPQAAEILRDCDHIIHAGDLADEKTLEALKEIGTLSAVRGNNDKGEWAKSLEKTVYAQICGLRFLIIHDKKELPKDLEDVDILIYGHSHRYVCEKKNGILWLNPGSCGRRRFGLPATMAVMEIEKDQFHVEKHILEEGSLMV